MSFSALPPVPVSGLTVAEFQLLAAIHQNITLLIGQNLAAYKAVISGQITLSPAPDASISVVDTTDISTVANSIQYLINDVQNLRDTLNILIAQLQT